MHFININLPEFVFYTMFFCTGFFFIVCLTVFFLCALRSKKIIKKGGSHNSQPPRNHVPPFPSNPQFRRCILHSSKGNARLVPFRNLLVENPMWWKEPTYWTPRSPYLPAVCFRHSRFLHCWDSSRNWESSRICIIIMSPCQPIVPIFILFFIHFFFHRYNNHNIYNFSEHPSISRGTTTKKTVPEKAKSGGGGGGKQSSYTSYQYFFIFFYFVTNRFHLWLPFQIPSCWEEESDGDAPYISILFTIYRLKFTIFIHSKKIHSPLVTF